MEAAHARLRLRQQQGDMKKAISAARQSSKAAERALSAEIKKVEKAIMDTKKSAEKASAAKDKAESCIPTGDRKVAAGAAATAQKAAAASQAAWRSGEEALTVARATLLSAYQCCENLRKKETELKQLQDAASAILAEEEDLDQEDEQEETAPSYHDTLLHALKDAETSHEDSASVWQGALTSANVAAVAALLSVCTSAQLKACEKERKLAAAANRAAAARARPAAHLRDITNTA